MNRNNMTPELQEYKEWLSRMEPIHARLDEFMNKDGIPPKNSKEVRERADAFLLEVFPSMPKDVVRDYLIYTLGNFVIMSIQYHNLNDSPQALLSRLATMSAENKARKN